MKKVILYVRVSTDEQAKLGYSLGHQELILTKFCELKGYEVVGIYREDFSAKNFERPEYKKLFRYCKSNKREVDYVLISKWDRFSRNQTDALQEIKGFNALGIEVNAAEQWIDFAIPQNKMMLAIYLTIPEIDNDVRGINTKMGLRRSLKDGRWTGRAPIGYKNGKDHRQKPVIQLGKDADLVRESFELFSTGLYATEEVRRIMYKKGLKVSRTRFPEMLKNVLYMGNVFIAAYKEEEDETIQGIHEPIVSPELFNKVQRIFREKSRGKKKHYDKLNDATPLRALLTCPKCGNKMTSSASKGRNQYYNYYHCRPVCGERIPCEKAHAALYKYFDQVSVKPEIAKLYMEVMENIYSAEESGNDKDIKKLKELHIQAGKKLTSLEEKFIMNEIEKDSYHLMKPKFKEEIKELKERILEMEENETNLSQYLKFGINVIQNLKYYYENANIENKQKLIGSIFPENIIIENCKCRTTRESEVIVALKGFEAHLKQEMPTKMLAFPVVYPCNE